jgi:hypothetical protein
MASIKFVGQWSKTWQEQFKIPKGYLLIKPKDIYKKNIGKVLTKLNEFQVKKNEIRDIDITIEYHYRKRTLDQNALMWALYQIEANEMNAGMQCVDDITPEYLYTSDLVIYAPRIEIKVNSDEYSYIKSEYEIEHETPIRDEKGNVAAYELQAILTSSKYTTVQMAQWVDRIFNRLAFNGVACTNPADIQDYWVKWRNMLNDEKITLHDDLLTNDEYRRLNPICEACGKFIGDGSGQLAHIQSKGSGGPDYTSNYLHLCNECHIETQHKKGYNHFLKLYPHLKFKVEVALRREYV